MFDMQCAFSEYARFHIPGDHELGIPEEGWNVNVDKLLLEKESSREKNQNFH